MNQNRIILQSADSPPLSTTSYPARFAAYLIALYRNERLFFEMYKAFMEGRASKNPSDFWYQGELGFFDYYIIPLARKLQECGVFGVSSDEYLSYAQSNRQEWEKQGQSVVLEMVEAAKKEFSATASST
jgi:hypothetical protein